MSWLFAVPFVLLAALFVASVLGAMEVGHRLSRLAPVDEQLGSTISAPLVGLVALLLAFSFSMAGERHAIRREAAVREANSIGTFWLRTSLLPEPTRSEMQARVRLYVDLHLEHRAADIDETKTVALEGQARRLQQELWTLLAEDARRAPESSRLRLVTPALNAMIDDAASVLSAGENRLPEPIFLYLFLLVGIAGVVIGYRPGGAKRNLILWVLFATVVSGVLVVLIDMDHPRRGLIQTSVAPYLRLRVSMQGNPP
jgi:hypothetical protein